MEDIFESLLGIAVVIFAIYRNYKKKQKKQAEKPAKPAAPAEVLEKPGETAKPARNIKPALTKVSEVAKQIALEEILEITGDDDKEENITIPDDIAAVVPSVQGPAAVVPPMPAMPVVTAGSEGDCPHPEHEPMPGHEMPAAEIPRSVRRDEKPVETIKAQRRFDSAAMRKAVVTAEILGRPVALRRR